MVFGCLLAVVASAPIDSPVWNSYAPKETDVRFRLPGKATFERIPDRECAFLGRFRAKESGFQYTIVIGDVGAKGAAVYQRLWKEARFGEEVKATLRQSLQGSAKENGGKLLVEKYREVSGFPVIFGALQRANGSGSAIAITFTKRGIVFTGVQGRASKELVLEANKLLDGLDLTARM